MVHGADYGGHRVHPPGPFCIKKYLNFSEFLGKSINFSEFQEFHENQGKSINFSEFQEFDMQTPGHADMQTHGHADNLTI